MSWAFISTMSQNPQQSYVQVLQSTRGMLLQKYSQVPQLSVRLTSLSTVRHADPFFAL